MCELSFSRGGRVLRVCARHDVTHARGPRPKTAQCSIARRPEGGGDGAPGDMVRRVYVGSLYYSIYCIEMRYMSRDGAQTRTRSPRPWSQVLVHAGPRVSRYQ